MLVDKRKKLQLIALHNSMRVELNRLFCIDDTIIINNGIDFSKFRKGIRMNFVVLKNLPVRMMG